MVITAADYDVVGGETNWRPDEHTGRQYPVAPQVCLHGGAPRFETNLGTMLGLLVGYGVGHDWREYATTVCWRRSFREIECIEHGNAAGVVQVCGEIADAGEEVLGRGSN